MSDNAESNSLRPPSPKPELLRKESLNLLPQASQGGTLVAIPTTAVTLENMDQPEITSNVDDEEEHSMLSPGLRPSMLNVTSQSDRVSIAGLVNETLAEDHSESDETETNHLTEILQNLMAQDIGKARGLGSSSLQNLNFISGGDTEIDDNFIRSRLLPDKLDSSASFLGKLKQVFVLSTAGKPIYSLNGSDDNVMGYMGLITTIVSSYQEIMKSEFHHITQDGFKLVVMNKSPLILVLITKVAYELEMTTDIVSSTIERQLMSVYNYLLSVLSAPVIRRSFERRMNYDLRKVLSNQDIAFLDSMLMKQTYGLSTLANEEIILDSNAYISHMLGSAIRCVRITHTTRCKLNSILLSSRKLSVKDADSDAASVMSKVTNYESKRYLANDLLFGFICINDKVLTSMRPTQHRLRKDDVNLLLAIISLHYGETQQEEGAELWIPLCMPNFNDTGFLYVYVKRFILAGYPEPLSLALLGANKNSFFELKQVGSHIISKILCNKSLKTTLTAELVEMEMAARLVKDLNCTFIKHFIYRQKTENQFFMDDIKHLSTETDNYQNIATHLQVLYFYTSLHNANSTTIKDDDKEGKRLTYTRWQRKDGWVTGFLLSSKTYDFYCLCGGSVQAQHIIDQSIRIIKWVEKYKKRLFIGEAITF